MGVLAEFDHKSHNILLDGEFRRSAATEGRDVIDPATGDVIAEIAETTAAEVDAAVEAGQAAYKKWWRMSALERAEVMHEIANDLIAMKPQLAEALTREMGKPTRNPPMKLTGRCPQSVTMPKSDAPISVALWARR